MKQRVIGCLGTVALLATLCVFCFTPQLNTTLYNSIPYNDLGFTMADVLPILDDININRAELQKYMATRFPKVAELDWEHPQVKTVDGAYWDFRWLSKDWRFEVTFDSNKHTIRNMKSYEVVTYE